VALAAALAVLGVTAFIALGLGRLEHARVTERAQSEVQTGALRAVDALRALLAGFEAQTQSATSNPRLVAALNAEVDSETLRDLLLTEPWWEPFRLAVNGYGLVRRGTGLEVTSQLPEQLDVTALVTQARSSGKPVSEMLAIAGQVLAVVSCPVVLTDQTDLPVLVATKIVDVGTLALVAERAGGVVGITDGRHLLVAAAPRAVAAAGGAHLDLGELKKTVVMAAPSVTFQDTSGVALAALPLGGTLRLVMAARLSAGAAGSSGGSSWPIWATMIIGLAVAGSVFWLLSRRLPFAESPGSATERVPAPISAVGRYTVIDRIGQGGMAEIYSAVTTGEGGFRRPVVIKRLRPELTGDQAAVAQFCDEANLLAALHHPNIVAVLDFGRAGDQLFLAQEYVLGRDLGRLVTTSLRLDHRPPPPRVVAHVCHELLKALDYAHSLRNEEGRPLGVVHRDVSPENIMVSAHGEVKLLDFGVGIVAEGRTTKTEAGVVKGNVTYMSPEQARGLPLDARSDLYSLALVIYHALAGRPLYESETGYGLLMKAGTGPGPEEWAAVAQLPKGFGVLVGRALSARIEDRYQTAAEMAKDLEYLIADGAQQTQAVMKRLFGDDLAAESRRVAQASGPPKTRERMSM
jgi:hypothetical protein